MSHEMKIDPKPKLISPSSGNIIETEIEEKAIVSSLESNE